MKIVAFEGYAEALSFALRQGDKFELIVVVGEEEWRKDAFKEPVVLCNDLLPKVKGYYVESSRRCTSCGSHSHRVVKYDVFSEAARIALSKIGKVYLVQDCALHCHSRDASMTVTSATKLFHIDATEDLHIYTGKNYRDWVMRSNIRLSVNETSGPGCIAYFTASEIPRPDNQPVGDVGEISSANYSLHWLRTGPEKIIVKVTGVRPGSSIYEVEKRFDLRSKYFLKLRRRIRKEQERPSLFKNISFVAIGSVLRRWFWIYVSTWARVIFSMLVIAGVDEVKHHVNFTRMFIEESLRQRGLQSTVLLLSSIVMQWIAFLERRVREASEKRFLSTSALLSVSYLVGIEALREVRKYIWARLWPGEGYESLCTTIRLIQATPELSKKHQVVFVNESEFWIKPKSKLVDL